MAESTGGLDPYALTHIPAHIYSAGPAHYPRLYQLISSELWFQAQDRFDPTRRLYADSLSLGVRACAELPFPDGQSLLTPLMLVSLLRVTAASLASSIPAGAVEALNFFGEQHAADAYVQMQQDQVERCLSLCRLASAAHDFGDEGRCRDLLSQAQQQALAVEDLRRRAHVLASVAKTAGQAGQTGLAERAVQHLTDLVKQQNWPVTNTARKLDLLDRPPYLLALMEWDQKESTLSSYSFKMDRNAGMPPLIQCAAKQRDYKLLDIMLGEVELMEREEAVEALIEAGEIERAFQFLDRWGKKTAIRSRLQQAAARAAGRRGDRETILRLARYQPPAAQDKKRGESYLSFGERLADGAADKLLKTGGRLVGASPEALAIYWEGYSELVEAHPKEAGKLIQQLEGDLTQLGRWLSNEVAAYSGQINPEGSETPSRPASSRLVNGLINSGVWLAKSRLGKAIDLDPSEALTAQATWTALQGDLDRAERLAFEIPDPAQSDDTAGMLVELVMKRKQVSRAVNLAKSIQGRKERKAAYETIAKGLTKMPVDQAAPLLDQICRLATALPPEDSLALSGLPGILARTLARKGLLVQARALEDSVGEPARSSVRMNLALWAAGQRERGLLEEMLQKMEAQGMPGPASTDEVPDMGLERNQEPVKLLAELSIALARNGGQGQNENEARTWRSLAERAYSLADQHPLVQFAQTWIWLARAAGELGDHNRLERLAKRFLKWDFSGDAEYACVEVVIGLTRLGDFLEPGKDRYPPLVSAMGRKHNQALALAEMAGIIRQMPPQKRGLFKTLDRDFLEIRSESLLKDSIDLLQLSDRYYPLMSHSKLFKAPAPGPNFLSGRFFEHHSQLPSGGIIGGIYIPQVLRLIELYVQGGLIQPAERLVEDVSQWDQKEEAQAHLIRCLLLAGEEQRAAKLTEAIKSNRGRWLVWLAMAEVHMGGQLNRAVQEVLDVLLPNLWSIPKTLEVLPRLCQVIASLPAKKKLEAGQVLLYEAAQRDRRTLLGVLSSLLPGLESLLEREALADMVSKLLESESWWSINQVQEGG